MKLPRLKFSANRRVWLGTTVAITIISISTITWFIWQNIAASRPKVSTISGAKLQTNHKDQLATVQAGNTDKALLSNKFIILDVRNADDYRVSHIKGALSAPAQALDQNIYDPSLSIVIYSPNPAEISAATDTLKAKGINTIMQLTDSLDNLKKAGYTITTD